MPDAVDEKLAQGLKQARKKARNFVLFGKGTSVLKLLVDKKPIKAGAIQEARAESKANVIIRGVVQGNGAELVFSVVGEEPGLKIAALREFLSEQSGMKFKPRFEVVPELAEIDDRDEETESDESSSEDVVATTDAPPVPPPPPPTGAVPAEQALAALIATMKSLAPHVQAFIQKSPDKRDAVVELMNEFQKRAKAGDVAGAKAIVTALGQAIKQSATPAQANESTGSPGSEFWPAWEKARDAWRDAMETVNQQLEKLRVQLVSTDDPDLKQIAEFGLNAITKDHRVPLEAALLDLDRARGGDASKAVAAAREHVVDFRDHLDTDERVEACDDNPFDVTVTIQKSLDGALAELEQALGKWPR